MDRCADLVQDRRPRAGPRFGANSGGNRGTSRYTGSVRFRLEDLATAVDGTILPGEGRPIANEIMVDGVAIDSRTLEPGSLFVPLIAERDGHDFLEAALDAGAAAYLCSRDVELAARHASIPGIRVDDTDRALMAIGRLGRDRLTGPVIGITGSVGKTSVKDLTRAACTVPGRPTPWASEKSFNNEIGVPLTLANAPDNGAVVIVEMGARGVGHIGYLCEMARPTIGMVTAVALVHSELFGSIEAVAEGKGELVEALPADGVAVLNADNPYVAAMADRIRARVMTFGLGPGVTVAGVHGSEAIRPDVTVAELTMEPDLRPTVTFDVSVDNGPVRRHTTTLPVRGAHMAVNAAAAVATALAVGIEFKQAVDNLGSVELSPWRMEVTTAPTGATIINDSYNANPTSMRAALAALSDTGAARLVAVVGEMAELGEERMAEHRAVADEAAAAGITVIAIAAPDYGPSVHHVDTIEKAHVRIGSLSAGTAVLVKGSRVAGLERLARILTEPATSPQVSDATVGAE